MKRTTFRARAARALVAILAIGAVIGQGPVAAEPTDILRHENPGVSASASAYGPPAIGKGLVSEKTGAFTFSYPIAVPPGRRGMAPSLSLSYSSAAPLFGDVAAGWTLGLPEIRRDPGIGEVDAVGQPSRWRSTLGTGGRLVPFEVGSSADFRVWGDTSFTRYRRPSDDVWEAQALDGTVHRFETLGLPTPNERFVLVSTTDRFGNAIRYDWQRSYSPHGIPTDELASIEYTHNDVLGLGAFAKVTFVHGSMATCGAARTPVGARLDGLSPDGDVYVRGALPLTMLRTEVRDAPSAEFRTVREISLEYEGTTCSGPSHSPMRLLTSIQESARSPEGTWTTLPATTFEYGDIDQIPWALRKSDLGDGKLPFPDRAHALSWGTRNTGNLGSRDWFDTYGQLVDLDGDGSQDRVIIQPDTWFVDEEDQPAGVHRASRCLARVYRNARGAGFAAPPYNLILPTFWHDKYCSLSVQPAIPPYGSVPSGTPTVGNGEASPINVYRFVDLDSDGLTDLVSSIFLPSLPPPRGSELPHPNCDPNVPNPTWVICNGPGMDVPPRVPTPNNAREGQTYDGWYIWRWYRNTGSGQFSRTPSFVASPIPLEIVGETPLPNDWFHEDQSGLFDLDGDGHLDAVWVAPDEETWLFWRGDGSGGFEGMGGDSPFRWKAPRLSTGCSSGCDEGIRTTLSDNIGYGRTYLTVATHDVNGDGKPDLLADDPDLKQDRLVTYLNTGDGFSSIPEVVRNEAKSSETLASMSFAFPWNERRRIFSRRVADFNGDGNVDLLALVDPDPAIAMVDGAGRARIQFGVGVSLEDGPTIEIPFAEAFGTGLFGRGYGRHDFWYMDGDLVDLDGDGYTDVVGNDWQFGFDPQRPAPGLLTTISSGRDAITEIEYAPRTDSKVVHCNGPTCRGGSMVPRWVVESVSISSAGRSEPATSTYFYQDPVVVPDETGHHAFRGFRRIDVIGPSTGTRRAKTVTDFDYSQDYRGLTSLSRTLDDARTVKEVKRFVWTLRNLGDSPWLTVPLLATERSWTCEPRSGSDWAQAEACQLQDAGVESVHAWESLSTSGPGGLVTAWVNHETTTTEAVGTARYRPRIARTSRTLVEDDVRYLLLETETSFHENIVGVEVLRAKEITEHDAGGLGLPERTKVWIEDDEYAVTARGHDALTGLLAWEQKPEQYRLDPNAPDDERVKTSFLHDAFAVEVAETENELGHRAWTATDRGTGVVTSFQGPNSWSDPSCNTGCETTYEGERYEIDGFGRVVQSWVSDFDPTQGYQLRVASTTTYVDEPGTWAAIETHSYEELDDPSSAVRDRVEVDATGLVLSQVRGGVEYTPTTFAYAPAGQLKSASVPDPSDDQGTVEYRWEYDALGRETRSIRPDGTGTTTSYGVRTQLVKETGVSGDVGPLAWTTLETDVFGNLVTVVEWDFEDIWGGPTTYYQHDALGRVTRIEDPDGIVTELAHDGAGRRRSIRRGDRVWSYGYDHNGNQTTIVVPHAASEDPLAHTMSIVYDELDRPVSRIQGTRDLSSSELAVFGDGTAGWVYDEGLHGLGRLATTIVATGGTGLFSRSLEYDARGNPVAEYVAFEVWNGAFSDARVLRRRFGAQDQLVFVEHADALGGEPATQIELRHDERGLPQQARWVNRPGVPPGGAEPDVDEVDPRRLSHVIFDQGARPIERRAPDLLHRQQWSYDALGRPTQLAVQGRLSEASPWQTAASHAMTYFARDDVRTATVHVAVGSEARTEEWGFEYDARHQLIGATSNAYDGAWTYTPGGRLLTVFADLGSTGRDYTYVYTAAEDGDPETVDYIVDNYAQATRDLTWDRTGNLRERQVAPDAIYRYDGADDLREARTGVGSSATRGVYWYDAGGQRQLALTIDPAGQPLELRFWLGDTEIHYDAAGAVTQTLAYVSLGDPVARITDRSEAEYTFHDNRHNLIAVLDDAGNATASFTYSPWNETLHTLGEAAAEHRRRFNGKEADGASGLSYYGFRYYDPALLIWNQADPLFRFAPDAAWTEPRDANLYTFSLNNPVRFYDPDGRQSRQDLASSAANHICIAGGGCTHEQWERIYALASGREDDGKPIETQRDPQVWKDGVKLGSLAPGVFGAVMTIADSVIDPVGPLQRGVRPRGSKTKTKKNPAGNGGLCFPGGMKVHTPRGLVDISEIAVGDEVLAHDFDTGETVVRRVVSTSTRWAERLVEVDLDGEIIASTLGHPYWEETTSTWIAAGDLERGMEVRLEEGGHATVRQLDTREGLVEVYNFEVAEEHNYFVGERGVLVHNGPGDDYNKALNAALEWLEGRGFKAEVPVPGKFGPNQGKAVGMSTADGKVGFRVEFDKRSGAHINAWDHNAPKGKQKSPHFTFEGDQRTVNKIIRQFRCN